MRRSILGVLFAFILTLVLLEIGLRISGFSTLKLNKKYFQSSPIDCYHPKDKWGVGLIPGTYHILLNEKLEYTATHTSDSMRTTGMDEFSADVPRVQFHGCSFTYGMAVNDEETYPFQLQQRYPKLNIENRAVSGYGQIQLYNSLVENPEMYDGTQLIILNYLSFHDERNVMNLNFQHKVNMGYQIRKGKAALYSDFYFPYAELINDSIHSKFIHISDIDKSLFWESNSATIHTLNQWRRKMSVNDAEDFELSKALIKGIAKSCKKMNMDLLISIMSDDERGKEMMAFCESNGIGYLDISVNFSDHSMVNQPHDYHPSAKAHDIFLEKLDPIIREYSSKLRTASDLNMVKFD